MKHIGMIKYYQCKKNEYKNYLIPVSATYKGAKIQTNIDKCVSF